MQESFSLEDVINVMIELEVCGNEHYLFLAGQTTDESMRKLFLSLANAEKNHKIKYEHFKKDILFFEHETVSYEYQNYIISLLKRTIQFLTASIKQNSIEEGVQVAIQLEKDTILFLVELKSMVGQKFSTEMEQIILEEQEHLKLLNQYIV